MTWHHCGRVLAPATGDGLPAALAWLPCRAAKQLDARSSPTRNPPHPRPLPQPPGLPGPWGSQRPWRTLASLDTTPPLKPHPPQAARVPRVCAHTRHCPAQRHIRPLHQRVDRCVLVCRGQGRAWGDVLASHTPAPPCAPAPATPAACCPPPPVRARGPRPSTRCLAGQRTINPADIPEDVTPESINPLGNYAVQIQWADGFNQVGAPAWPAAHWGRRAVVRCLAYCALGQVHHSAVLGLLGTGAGAPH